MSHFGMTEEQSKEYAKKLERMKQNHIDVDRQGNWYLLKVVTTKNKKDEVVQTIMKVDHLGQLLPEQANQLAHYAMWERAFESGDFKAYWDRNPI